MASKIVINLIDDLDGTDLRDADGETVSFGLDGATYEIDLSQKNADSLRGLFADYVAHGRQTNEREDGGQPRRTSNQEKSARARSREAPRAPKLSGKTVVSPEPAQQGSEMPDAGRAASVPTKLFSVCGWIRLGQAVLRGVATRMLGVAPHQE